jgi:hypothetical protein
MHQLFGPHNSTGTTGGDCRGAISMVSRLASGRNPTRKPDFRPGGITCIVKFVGCRSCGSDSLGAEVAALYFDMSGTPPHARQRSRSRTPPPVGWALGLPVEIVDQTPPWVGLSPRGQSPRGQLLCFRGQSPRGLSPRGQSPRGLPPRGQPQCFVSVGLRRARPSTGGSTTISPGKLETKAARSSSSP